MRKGDYVKIECNSVENTGTNTVVVKAPKGLPQRVHVSFIRGASIFQKGWGHGATYGQRSEERHIEGNGPSVVLKWTERLPYEGEGLPSARWMLSSEVQSRGEQRSDLLLA